MTKYFWLYAATDEYVPGIDKNKEIDHSILLDYFAE
jgi:hypothetical protein